MIGLREGKIVFDGAPSKLDSDVLTEIYGEEDWSATLAKSDDAETGAPGPGKDLRAEAADG